MRAPFAHLRSPKLGGVGDVPHLEIIERTSLVTFRFRAGAHRQLRKTLEEFLERSSRAIARQ